MTLRGAAAAAISYEQDEPLGAHRSVDVPGVTIGTTRLAHITASVELRLTASREADNAERRDTHAVGPRVLVVDDHPGFRLQARLMLEDAGYDVVGEAADAATAISAARELRPDVVLLDVGLPDRNGFFVADVLAADARPLAVVLISGRGADEYGTRVAACHARGFLAKADLTGDALGGILSGEADP